MRLIRAGFEPRRGPGHFGGMDRPENDHTLGLATRTHGSKPARCTSRNVAASWARRVFRPTGIGLANIVGGVRNGLRVSNTNVGYSTRSEKRLTFEHEHEHDCEAQSY
jgi:hypothetical protein